MIGPITGPDFTRAASLDNGRNGLASIGSTDINTSAGLIEAGLSAVQAMGQFPGQLKDSAKMIGQNLLGSEAFLTDKHGNKIVLGGAYLGDGIVGKMQANEANQAFNETKQELLDEGRNKWANNVSGTTQIGTGKQADDKTISDVLAGKYGNGAQRRQNLEKAGYNYESVQQGINTKLGKAYSGAKQNEQMAKDIYYEQASAIQQINDQKARTVLGGGNDVNYKQAYDTYNQVLVNYGNVDMRQAVREIQLCGGDITKTQFFQRLPADMKQNAKKLEREIMGLFSIHIDETNYKNGVPEPEYANGILLRTADKLIKGGMNNQAAMFHAQLAAGMAPRDLMEAQADYAAQAKSIRNVKVEEEVMKRQYEMMQNGNNSNRTTIGGRSSSGNKSSQTTTTNGKPQTLLGASLGSNEPEQTQNEIEVMTQDAIGTTSDGREIRFDNIQDIDSGEILNQDYGKYTFKQGNDTYVYVDKATGKPIDKNIETYDDTDLNSLAYRDSNGNAVAIEQVKLNKSQEYKKGMKARTNSNQANNNSSAVITERDNEELDRLKKEIEHSNSYAIDPYASAAANILVNLERGYDPYQRAREIYEKYYNKKPTLSELNEFLNIGDAGHKRQVSQAINDLRKKTKGVSMDTVNASVNMTKEEYDNLSPNVKANYDRGIALAKELPIIFENIQSEENIKDMVRSLADIEKLGSDENALKKINIDKNSNKNKNTMRYAKAISMLDGIVEGLDENTNDGKTLRQAMFDFAIEFEPQLAKKDKKGDTINDSAVEAFRDSLSETLNKLNTKNEMWVKNNELSEFLATYINEVHKGSEPMGALLVTARRMKEKGNPFTRKMFKQQ